MAHFVTKVSFILPPFVAMRKNLVLLPHSLEPLPPGREASTMERNLRIVTMIVSVKLINFNSLIPSSKMENFIEITNDGKADGKCALSGSIGSLFNSLINVSRRHGK